MKIVALGLFLIVCPVRPCGAGESVEESLLTGATLTDMGLEQEALAVFLDILKSSPGDIRALKAVKELAARAASSAGGVSTAAVNSAELDNALDEAALEMLKEVREPELRLGFARARKLFNEGRFLLAYDVFRLLENRKVSQDWLKDELRRYMEERLPRDMERGRRKGRYGINSEAYINAFRDLRKGRWEGVYRNLGLWLRIAADEKLPGGEPEKEAKLLMARMKNRVSLFQSREGWGPWLGEARQYFLKQDYAEAVNMLEAFIPVAGGRELSAAWKELGIVYDYNALMELIGKAENAMDREQYAQASVLIANAQERYPGNRKVLELIGSLLEKTRMLAEKRREERARTARIPAAKASSRPADHAQDKVPGRAAAVPQMPKASVKKPTSGEKAAADSYYIQGISAYAMGNIDKAWSSWNAALKLVPDHQKSIKALERLGLEMKPGGE